MKICKKCKIEKPKNEFDKHSARKDGLQPQCKICRREHRAKNAKNISDYQRAYRASRPGERSRQQTRYAAKNPEAISAIRRNRRARNLNAEGKHTADDVKSIFQSQLGLCANCKTKLSTDEDNKYHIDHVMPLALGGSNWPENLQCLCPKCNMSKGAKHPDIWAKENGRML